MNTFKLRLLSVFILVCLLAVPPGSYAQAGGGGITYVDRDATGLNNGTSWANAYTDLQTALTYPWSSNIWVAEGTYKPTAGTDRTATFLLEDGIYLYGGFAGNESDLSQRDLSAHVTILSGDIGTVGVSTDNSYHVVAGNSSGIARLDGFTITGGNANGALLDSVGGGLFRLSAGGDSLELIRVVFQNNSAVGAGGGIYVNNNNLILEQVTLKDNTGGNYGGGLYLQAGTAIIVGTIFNGNSAQLGGGLYLSNSGGVTVYNSTFYNNRATAGAGGGLYLYNSSTATVFFSTFSHNQASSDGAGIYSSGSTLTLSSNILANSAPRADCYIDVSTLTSRNNLIEVDPGGVHSCGTYIVADPKLGPLGNYGGFTQTMALLPGSPAINFANTADCPVADQRGMLRPLDVHCDIGAYEKEPDTWYIRGQGIYVYGERSDTPVPADYNGDGMAEMAVFRPSNSTWYIRDKYIAPIVYGAAGDIPVVADYTGDGLADVAVFRPSNSTWYIRGLGSYVYGTAGDIPVVADYTGDGLADIAVFRPSNSTWYIRGVGPAIYGMAGDIPVVGDYTGDGLADIAVFRPSNGTWYVRGVGPTIYGTTGDIPVPADYSGDGITDMAVFRSYPNGGWYIRGIGYIPYGTSDDILVPADYNGDGTDDIAVFRPWHYP